MLTSGAGFLTNEWYNAVARWYPNRKVPWKDADTLVTGTVQAPAQLGRAKMHQLAVGLNHLRSTDGIGPNSAAGRSAESPQVRGPWHR